MRREALVLLIGASLVGGADLEAQRRGDRRDRDRDDRGRVERLEPVRAPGRVVARPVVWAGPDHRGSARVVYSTRGSRRAYARHHGWVRVDWGRAVRFRPLAAPGRAFLNRRELRVLLGPRAVHRLQDAGFAAGLRGPLRGHWLLDRRAGHVLVVTMGGSDVAELIDHDRDGFVDEAWLVTRGRYRPAALGW